MAEDSVMGQITNYSFALIVLLVNILGVGYSHKIGKLLKASSGKIAPRSPDVSNDKMKSVASSCVAADVTPSASSAAYSSASRPNITSARTSARDSFRFIQVATHRIALMGLLVILAIISGYLPFATPPVTRIVVYWWPIHTCVSSNRYDDAQLMILCVQCICCAMLYCRRACYC
jgi:hypothetical protein